MKRVMDALSTIKRQGKRVIGCFPLYPPLELLHSFGLTPITLWGMKSSSASLTESDRHLQNFTCGVGRCLTELVLGDAAELFDSFLMYNACDTLRNLPEIIESGLRDKGIIKPILRMHIPAISPDSPGARPYLESGIAGIIQKLEEHTGKSFSKTSFINSAQLYQRQRELSRTLEEIAGKGSTLFRSYCETLQCGHYIPVEEHITLLETEIIKAGKKVKNDHVGRPIMLSGIQVTDMSIIDTIEASGLSIVVNDIATLSRSYGYSPKITDDPIRYYCDFYFNHYPCTTMLAGGDRRIELIKKNVREYGIKGVVFIGEKFCEYEYFEMPFIEDVLKKEGVKILNLEYGIGESENLGTINNRIAAFAEILTMQMSI